MSDDNLNGEGEKKRGAWIQALYLGYRRTGEKAASSKKGNCAAGLGIKKRCCAVCR